MSKEKMDRWEINWVDNPYQSNIKLNGEIVRGVQVLEFKPKSIYEYDPETEDSVEVNHVPEGWR